MDNAAKGDGYIAAGGILDVLIIGSGISGMTVAIDMIRQDNGRNFAILEKGHRVGGTWSDNEYSGACCDVWSHLYSLSFEPNPHWTRAYPTQPEIQRYLAGVAHKYQLERNIRFGAEVVDCLFDPASGLWSTRTQDGSTYTSRFLVSAVGQLSSPQLPDITGLSKFKGKAMHSARWDKSYDFTVKTVAVIGNGATAIQIVPQIAKVAQNVVVFQRSPNWITPRNDVVIGPLRRAAYQYLPLARRLHRGHLMDIRESFWEVLVDTTSPVHHMVKDLTTQALERDLPGRDRLELRRKLTPDYPPGCKRILISDDYYPALAQQNVTLETAQIMHATPDGLWVDGGWNSVAGDHQSLEHNFDVLVCATGFKATQFLHSMNVRVRGKSTTLHEQWDETGAQAYLGMTVAGFPNFAVVYGPNTNLGHNSIILMIEAQSQYINRLISAVCKSSMKPQVPGTYLSIQPKLEESNRWNGEVQENLGKSTLASALCSSWYRAIDGRITTSWSETAVSYQNAVSSVAWGAFDLEGPGAKELLAKGRTSWARVVEESRMLEHVLAWGSVVGMAVGAAACVWQRFS